MEMAIGAARWVVGRALGPVTDGLLESWAASSELGPNVRALKMELLYAQGMLDNARGRDVRSPALRQLLLELQDLAYNADDVLDELEYFRIQDELEGTYETTDADDRGLVGSLVLNARHTARAAVARMLAFSSCSCASASSGDPAGEVKEDAAQGCLLGGCLRGGQNSCKRRCSLLPGSQKTKNEDQDEADGGCVHQIISSARNTTTNAVGKCLPCCSFTSVIDGARSSKASKSAIHAPKLKFDRVKISKIMTDIVEQLKPLCSKVATILELELFGSNRSTTQGIAFDRPKTTPSITEPILYGRESQKRNVVDAITNGKYSANDLTVLSIVGPGGIGKTTFTQHIYEELKSHFHVSIWTCVSLDFSANMLSKDILEKIPKGKEEDPNASLEDKIAKRLESKTFLLVLDDMWKFAEDEWKKLLAPFKKGGANGSMVIVTTRFPKVAGQVATKMNYLTTMERLEYEDCMNFFLACVFGDQQQSWEGHAGLQKIGKDIVKKLKGSPLAVKTVGRLLRNKLTSDYWKRVLESREWEFQTNDDDIMPALKLSYNYLRFELQQCFSYCALFPEDYEYNSKELIQLWIGLGLLDAGGEQKRIEDIGEDYLNELVNYGFFERKLKEESEPYYLIHDLLHELAVNVSSFQCLRIHGSDMRSVKNPSSIRHLSIVIDNSHVKDRITYENAKRELSILLRRLKTENLHTLMLFGEHHGGFSKTLGDVLRKGKSLRVILLSGASYYMEDVFHNISELVHLRYLRISQFSSNEFASIHIPKGISRFYHMMVLDLQQCKNLCGSLREISNLVRIRHLLVPDIFHSEIYEVGKLKFLQELRRFDVKKEMSGFDLKQLGQLVELQGSLEICNLQRVGETKEALEARLEHMNMLSRLQLDWGSDRSNKKPKEEDDVLENLKPHSNIQEICIKGHGGDTYPKWLGVDLFNENLESLCLDGVAWKSLPPIGELRMANDHGKKSLICMTSQIFPNLKRIELVNIQTLVKWCEKDSRLFRDLEVFIVSDCPELTELSFSHATSCPSGEVDMMHMFPKLREIKISNCPKLLSMPPIPWTSALCVAEIARVGTDIDKLSYKKNQQTKCIEVQMGKDAPGIELWKILAFHILTEIEEFVITNCPPVSLNHMEILVSLKKLSILDCRNVMCPVEGENNACCLFLEYLIINRCGATGKELTQFISYFPNISKLELRGCKMVTGLAAVKKSSTATIAPLPPGSNEKTEDEQIGQQLQRNEREQEIEDTSEGLLLLPPQIKELQISDCPDLRLCSSSLDESTRGLQSLPPLRLLRVARCPKFISNRWSSRPYCPFPISLHHLYLKDMEGEFTLEPLTNLSYLFIEDCGDLRSNVLWPLLAQGHLTKLFIYGCPNLFPGSEPSSPLDEHHPYSYGVQELRTDGKAGIFAMSICARLCASLTKLVFIANNDIESFTNEQEKTLQILTSLEDLEIQRCKKLQSLPAGLSQISSLKKLHIAYCESIRWWPKDGLPSSLTELRIQRCPAIRSLPKGDLPGSLQTLDVSDSEGNASELKNNEEFKRQCRKLQGTIPIIKA